MDFGVFPQAGGVLVMFPGGVGRQIVGGFSNESEHDLAAMVSDFLENGAGGGDSWYSSDSDSGFSDLAHLVDDIQSSKHSGAMDQFESDLLSVVHSLLLSINEDDLRFVNSNPCNISCIRFQLVKLLRLSGYDAAICGSRWQGSGKVPGGHHEYIDVINYDDNGNSERVIIDIDFRSHFEIARAVESYDAILRSLPVVYVGSLPKLKQLIPVMVDAARSSLKQNSMTLPPWRSLAYLQSKWDSSYQRQLTPDKDGINNSSLLSNHMQCIEHLKRLKASIQSDLELEHLPRNKKVEKNRRLKLERRKHSSFRNL